MEDDRALGMYLKKALEHEGHQVEWVGDGEAALAAVMNAPPELLMLDLNLPRKDGVEVLEVVHRLHAGVSVLVLTGRSQVEERVRCLNLGADDCLVKPFSYHELSARCGALLRRRTQQADPVLRCGALSMNRMERSVECDARAVELTGKEFALLEFLLRHQGECVSRSTLLREVWRMSPDAGTNVVDVYINYLRKKLCNASAQTEVSAHGTGTHGMDNWIETMRGAGYRLKDRGVEARNSSADRAAEHPRVKKKPLRETGAKERAGDAASSGRHPMFLHPASRNLAALLPGLELKMLRA